MRKRKHVISLISLLISAIIIFSSTLAGAATSPDAKLYNTYGDSMLFQHSQTAVLAGTAAVGSKISYKLINSEQKEISSGNTTADGSGEFRLEFQAPKGGYDEYTINMYQNDVLFDSLTEVVFGEQWIASGQSNMHLFLRFTKLGMEMINNQTTGNKNVRYLDMPLIPSYNGNQGTCPLDPAKDIEGANWFKGDSEKVYNISGVAFSFAEKLQEELDMPVGVLCDYLGGSSITSWLSRESIDSDKEVKNILGDRYIKASTWDESEKYNEYVTGTFLYNLKTAPLKNFKVAGMIWYQGESDCAWDYGNYSKCFNLLQKQLTKDFHYAGSSLPMIYAGFADNDFGDGVGIRRLSAELGDFTKSEPSSRALVTMTDIPLDYTIEAQTVHPITKQPVGERMADAAKGLVYGLEVKEYSAPVLVNAKVENMFMYLTYSNVGDGLISEGNTINGFTMCGKNGVYVPATAQIISKDTVKLYCEDIENPVSAMYAQGINTSRANLFSSCEGEKLLPVCSTITNREYEENIWHDYAWTDCETRTTWHYENLNTAGYFPTWNSDDASIMVTNEAAYSGESGLKISASKGSFSIYPEHRFYDEYLKATTDYGYWNDNWKNFSKISVKLKNESEKDIEFSGIVIKTSSQTFSPSVMGEETCSVTVPADGQWHIYTFDLENMYLNGKKSVLSFTRKCLGEIEDVNFCFKSESEASLCFDDIHFTPYKYNCSHLRIFGFDIVSIISQIFSGPQSR